MPDKLNATNGQLKDSLVVGKTSQGAEVRAALLKVTRFSVVFEMYNPSATLRFSEVLQDFKITIAGHMLYSGKAVVRGLIHTGAAVVVCEATLNEASWMDVSLAASNGHLHKRLQEEYRDFITEWQKLYRVRPEYKVVLADMQTYFTDLRLWLDQLELGIRSSPTTDRLELEQTVAVDLEKSAKGTLTTLFERFEEAASGVGPDLLPAHQVFAKRQLHPLLLCSPFFHRCYVKPLGYAGDYEMVNMMLRNPCEGGSLFAKVMNLWFLDQPPVVAHRNRIDYLVRLLTQFAAEAAGEQRRARVLSVGCGPAQEVQQFLAERDTSSRVEFTMLDFNGETLEYNRSVMNDLKIKHQRRTQFNYVKKSVHHILKEGGKQVEPPGGHRYDFVYCAGLFDYLSEQVCNRLMNIMYDWVEPGGLLVATNVASWNPSIGWMEHVVDWHLIYRNAEQMTRMIPKLSPPDNARVIAEPSGVNIFVEVPKPDHA